MRSEAGPQIRFLSPAVGTSFWAQGGVRGEESYHTASRAGRSGLDPGGQWPGPLVGSPLRRSPAASALTCVGHSGLALTPARGTSGSCGIPFRAGTQPPSVPSRSCGPGDTGRQGQLPRVDSSAGPRRDTACGEGARATWTEGCLALGEVSGPGCSLGSGPKTPSAPASSPAAFSSSFSFIQRSLSSAGERGEAEGCPPSREAGDMEAKAASLGRPHEDPRLFSPAFSLKAAQGPADSAQKAGCSPRLGGEPLSVLDTDTSSSCSPDPSGLEGAAVHWDPLLRKCEPLLLECLLSNRRQLEVNALRLKLQKLQEKAVEEDDYDKAETLRQRLEDLEKERSSPHFRLPSREPALSGLLAHLGTQADAALRRAAQRAASEDTQALLGMEPTAQDSWHVALTRRDHLLQEKQQLQKEVEALQARMSVLAAKDRQLRRDIDKQDRLLWWQDCDLGPLMGGLSPSELQEVRGAVQDTLAWADQIPLPAGPPETIRSLQEKIKPLGLSLKEITAKVCRTERLCSALRKNINEIETQLPALLEAKMLAVSGNHFCTAKELTAEIRSLTAEREGLAGLLTKLSVLSSRNVTKLGRVKEDYSRLQRELDYGKAAHDNSVKENTVKYMSVLEDKLRRCKCPLLGKVWGADLEACQLLIQSLQLQEARGSLSAEDEKQMDDFGRAASTPAAGISPWPHSEDERRTPSQAFENWKAHLDPSHCAGSERREESCILSAEFAFGEKCEAIGEKLLHLEDQLHVAIHSHDEDLIQSLRTELQMVKQTLQALVLQLQPAQEAGEGEAAASGVTAGVWEAQARGAGAQDGEGGYEICDTPAFVRIHGHETVGVIS